MTPRLLLLVPTTSYRAEEFLAAAGKLGVKLTVATEHRDSVAGDDPALLALPFSQPGAAAARVAAWAREHPVAAVVGVDDATTTLAATLAAALGLPHNPVEAVAAARNKHRARVLLRDAGLPVPPFRLFETGIEPETVSGEVPYPCVLKPLVLSASQGVIRADDPAQFVRAFRRIETLLGEAAVAPAGDDARRILVEGFIPGKEVALEGLLDDGELRTLCLFDKPDPLDGPYFEETIYVTPSRLPACIQQAISVTVARAAAALGLRDGPVHAELRVNEAGPWILELNPRSIGGRCSRALRFGAGMSLEEIVLRHALSMEIPSLEREARAAGVMMLPIPRGGVLEAVEGRDEALAVPGIEELLVTAHAGQRLVPLPEGAPYLGFLFARGSDPAVVETALRAAHGRLRVVFRA